MKWRNFILRVLEHICVIVALIVILVMILQK